MRPDELLAILHTAAALKDTTRHCYTAQGRLWRNTAGASR